MTVFFSIYLAAVISSAILIFWASDLSFVEDLPLVFDFEKCLLLGLPEPPETWNLLEITFFFLLNSASFVQQWIFCLKVQMLWSTLSNHYSSLFLFFNMTTRSYIPSEYLTWPWRYCLSVFGWMHNNFYCNFLVITLAFLLQFIKLILSPSLSWRWFPLSNFYWFCFINICSYWSTSLDISKLTLTAHWTDVLHYCTIWSWYLSSRIS